VHNFLLLELDIYYAISPMVKKLLLKERKKRKSISFYIFMELTENESEKQNDQIILVFLYT